MSFADALNRPLPSKSNEETTNFDPVSVFESVEKELFGEGIDDILYSESDEAEECGSSDMGDLDECGDGSAMEGDDDDDDLDFGFDPDDLDEEDLAKLDAELTDDIDDISDDEDDDSLADKIVGNDDEKEVDLSSDEEMKADDMMSMAATTMLVNDELNAEEKASFIEDEADIACTEGFMTVADVNEMAQDLGLVEEAAYNKKMIIRLDAESKKKQLYALAINVCAAAKGDPDYRRLQKVMKMRKILRAKLQKKYHGQAMKRMKIYFNRLRKSKAGTLANLANKISK